MSPRLPPRPPPRSSPGRGCDPLYRVELPASLSAEESAELAVRLAALAQSGLPLEGGLYALADEVDRPRLARTLRNLAARLERGEKLETAIAANDSRLPAHLRGLIVAGLRSGRLPIVLDQFAVLTRRQQDLRRRVLLTLAYPALLLGIMAALAVLYHFLVVEQFRPIFCDFNTKLPDLTLFLFRFSGPVAWTMLGLTVAAVMVPLAAMFLPLGAWLGRATSWIPVLGTIVRDDRHAQFSHLMALLLEEEVPLPEALRLTSVALQGTMLARQCRTAAALVEDGAPLDQALMEARFPESLTAFVAWGQQKTGLVDAFRAAAEAFEARANSQGVLLNMVLLPLIYLVVVTFAAIAAIALFMPLIALISNLSGGGGPSAGRSAPSEDAIIGLLLLGPPAAFLIGVLTLMRIRWFTGPAPGDRKSGYINALQIFAWFLVIVGFLIGICMVLPALPTLLFATLAVITSMAYGKQVATQQYALLALVGAAARRSMPLETAFAAFGRERGGWMRQRAAEIVDMLHHGASLPATLNAVPGALPPEAVPLLCVGYENGALEPAIDQAIATRNLFEPVWQSIAPKIGYICVLPPFAVGIVTFICLKILPQYQKIFKDFNTRLPDFTLGFVYACRLVANFLWPLLAMAWLILAGLFVYVVLRYAGSIRWDLPGMAWLMRRRHIATVLDAIALAAQRQRPLGDALATLASAYPQRSIARRLWAACDDLQAGGDDLQCLHRHGLLGKADLALLQAARRNDNLAWAAGEMADSNRRRFIYRVNAVLQVIFPLVIVGYGLSVAAVAVAMLLPLANLIWRLSPS